MTSIIAAGTVGAPPAAAFAFLSDLRNHWRLTGRWISLEGLAGPANGPTGGTVQLRGPLGIRRTVHTSVLEADPATGVHGRARIGRRTEATVHWQIEPGLDQTARVTLRAEVLRLSWPDRLILLSFGGGWLAERFGETIARLDGLLSARDPSAVEVAA